MSRFGFTGLPIVMMLVRAPWRKHGVALDKDATAHFIVLGSLGRPSIEAAPPGRFARR